MHYNQRGVALYLSLAIMALLLALALGVSAILFGQMKTLTGIGFSVTALYAADTGIEVELYAKNYETQPAEFTYAAYLDINGNGTSGTIGQGSCPADLPDIGDACAQITIVSTSPLRISSVGYYKETRRALEITF